MSSITFFFIFVCIIAVLFLAINFILAPRNPYYEKISAFECGFHSFLQTRLPFNISFFVFAILFLLFDLEILLLYPFSVSAYNNDIYGLVVMLIFSIAITIGFVFELGKGALKISNKQLDNFSSDKRLTNYINYLGSYTSSQDIRKRDKKRINSKENKQVWAADSKGIIRGDINLNSVNLNIKFELKNGINKLRFLLVWLNVIPVLNIVKSLRCFFTFKSLLSKCVNNTKLRDNIETIFPFTDITKLYLIKKDFFFNYSVIIFYILALLFIISLFISFFFNKLPDFNILTIVPILGMVYLIFGNFDRLKYLSTTSLYVLSNILLLNLILAIFIYIVSNYIFYSAMSFEISLLWSKKIIGVLLSLKLTAHILKIIYIYRKNPKELIKKIGILILSLLVLSFFSLVTGIIFNTLSIFIMEVVDKNISNVESELKITDNKKDCLVVVDKKDYPVVENKNISNVESELKITDKSLNHNFNKDYPICVRGEGIYLFTADGRKILDAASGATVSNIGYNDKQVNKVIGEKFDKGNYYLASSYWKDIDSLNLSDWLVRSTDGKLVKAYLTVSGSDGVEASLKLARQYYYEKDHETTREYFIGRMHSYHGNTLGALSVSEFFGRQEPYKGILLDKVDHVSSCYSYRQQMEGESNEAFVAKKAAELEAKILELGPNNVCGFILEPVSGAALGAVPAVPGYLKAMQDVCHKYDVLLIFDEVLCGMGRTGTLHAWQAEGVVPDIQIIGKGLGAGYQCISGILVSQKVIDGLKSGQFVHGLTYDAMPVASVAALEVQKIIQENNLLDNVSKQGAYLMDSLKIKLGDHPNVGDIRGRGLLCGVEFVKDKITKEPFDAKDKVAIKIVELAKSPGYDMIVYVGRGTDDGVHGDHILITPPFIITEKDVDHIVEVLSAVVEKVFKEINK